MGGQDKGLIKFQDRPLIEHIIERTTPQAGEVIINANRNIPSYKKYGLSVISDSDKISQGPLAGIFSSLLASATPLLATVPCDSPFLPLDLISRLYASLLEKDADLAVAYSRRLQPVFCLGKKELSENLSEFLKHGGRKIDEWHKQVNVTHADFNDVPDCFININSPEELTGLEGQ